MCVCVSVPATFLEFLRTQKTLKKIVCEKKRRCNVEKLETAKAENSLCLKFQQLIIRKNNNNNKKCRYILNFQRAAIKIVAHKQGMGREKREGEGAGQRQVYK